MVLKEALVIDHWNGANNSNYSLDPNVNYSLLLTPTTKTNRSINTNFNNNNKWYSSFILKNNAAMPHSFVNCDNACGNDVIGK